MISRSTVLQSFRHVLGGDVGGSVQIGDGSRNLDHAMMTAGRKRESRSGIPKKTLRFGVEVRAAFDFPSVKPRVRHALPP